MIKRNEIISIIVPVYNIENYLEKSVKSIVNQTYKNIQILLIDDGSTDNSPQICDQLSKKYDKVFTYHKKNGGLADARNYGISKAIGQYITFVDGDDYINKNMIKYLYKAIIENDAQISVCNFKFVYEQNDYNNKNDNNNYIAPIIYSKEEALKQVVNLNSGFAPNVCNKMFRKDLFSEDCLFPKGKLYEDMIVTVKTLYKCKKVAYIKCDLYYYLQRNNSITKKFNNKEFDHIVMSQKVLNFIKKECPIVEKYYISYHAINYISIINKMIEFKKIDFKFYQEAQRYIKENWNIILRDDNLSRKKMIQIKIFKSNIRLYECIYKIWRKK